MSALDSPAAARNRARILRHTLTVYHDDVLIASVAGRIYPVGTQSGAYAPVARMPEGLGGLQSSHLGLLEGTVDVASGDEVHDGSTVYYCTGVTAWTGQTAVALERSR
jgi:hypothetical protein